MNASCLQRNTVHAPRRTTTTTGCGGGTNAKQPTTCLRAMSRSRSRVAATTCAAAAASNASIKYGANKPTPPPNYMSFNVVKTLQAGLGPLTHYYCASKHQLMTAGIVHVTSLTPPGSDNPTRAMVTNTSR
jgi:hypothetical protein